VLNEQFFRVNKRFSPFPGLKQLSKRAGLSCRQASILDSSPEAITFNSETSKLVEFIAASAAIQYHQRPETGAKPMSTASKANHRRAGLRPSLMTDLEVNAWPVNQPIPYARNSRKIPEKAVDKVAASI
jgi:hypothetical protein